MIQRLKTIPPWIWLMLLGTALLVPFANKAVNIDDPLFLWTARQIQQQPGNFYGFNINWYGVASPMSEVVNNPPGAAYYLALIARIAGWGELWLHLAFLLPALAVVCGIHSLAKHYCSHPMFAAVSATLTPVFLISATTLMCDVLMLAFWVWALVFWERGLQKNHFPSLAASGILAGLGILTKFNGLTLAPLLAVYVLIKKRGAGSWLAALVLPLLFLAGYEWITHWLYGRGMLSTAATYASHNGPLADGDFLDKGILGLIFAGGCFLPTLFYAPWLWPRRAIMIGFSAVVLLGIFLLPDFSPLEGVLYSTNHTLHWGALFQVVLFSMAGVNLLSLAVMDCWHRRDAVSVLLLLWTVGTFIFATVVNWTLNGRSLLPVMPALGILLARRMERQNRDEQRKFCWRGFWPALPAAGLSLLLVKADYELANADRRAAEELCGRYQKSAGKLWFEGHWGFQYYMENLGATALDLLASTLAPGDIIVLPSHHSNVYQLPADLARFIEALEYTPNVNYATMNLSAGAGFYAAQLGPLPFVFGRVSPARYYVFQAVRTRDFRAEPMAKLDFFRGSELEASLSSLPAAASSSTALAQPFTMDDPMAGYETALRANPNDAAAHFQLGLLLISHSDNAGAAGHFAEVLRINPDDGPAHFQMALLSHDQPALAIAHYRAALRAVPDSIASLNNLAWILASNPDARLRNGAEAVQLAERACELTRSNIAGLMGTRAAAYAEAGRFTEAVASATKAIQLARAGGDTNLLANNRKLLEFYRAERAYHQEDPAVR